MPRDSDLPENPDETTEARPRTRKKRATRSTRPVTEGDRTADSVESGAEPVPSGPAPAAEPASRDRGARNGQPEGRVSDGRSSDGRREDRGAGRDGQRRRSREHDDDLPKVTQSAAPVHDDERGEPVARPQDDKPRFDVELDEQRIDPDVQKVIRRLVRHGYEAFLVGGCVRDLLLDKRPKDFDVATSARPEQVRELFRNSRVIGRRFRLVHVLFHGGKVIEVATFRRNPNVELDDDASVPEASLLIRSDNVFGEAHEDALRRDFTINALFYDIDAKQVIDWVGGLNDVRGRVVNTIGEPSVRFREDPVRILRALKFAGRLELGIEPSVYDAIVACRDTLDMAARPRVAEEVLRLLRGGQARRTMFLAWETGVLELLLPELAALLYDSFQDESGDQPSTRFFRLLEFVDQRSESAVRGEADPLDDTVLWTLLLLEPLKEATEGAKDRGAAAVDLLEPMLERLAIPRRFADGMRRIVSILPRILSGKIGRLARNDVFDLVLDVAEADLFARGQSVEAIRAMRALPAGMPSRSAERPGDRNSRPPRAGRPRPTPRH